MVNDRAVGHGRVNIVRMLPVVQSLWAAFEVDAPPGGIYRWHAIPALNNVVVGGSWSPSWPPAAIIQVAKKVIATSRSVDLGNMHVGAALHSHQTLFEDRWELQVSPRHSVLKSGDERERCTETMIISCSST